jgi:16S rRNA processing protein RimM
VTAFPDRFVPGLALRWEAGGSVREVVVASARVHGRRLLLRFEGVEDAAAARELAAGELSVPESDAVEAPEDFYYSHRIEGWRCEDASGRLLGRASRLEHTSGGPMLSIDSGRAELVAVPFTRPIVVRIDPGEKRIVLDPPEGLMEL